MGEVNRHGLSRYIPADIRREVRRISKFGCIVCRRGFYQYEHIDPVFEEALEHNPLHICCLCGSCHDSVTRGQLSKELVKSAYFKLQNEPSDTVLPPVGPLDFHEGNAELKIGKLLYSPAVQTILRYHDNDLIWVKPGAANEPGLISAVFTDEDGNEILHLVENEWIGSLENWDIEVIGNRITVRRKHGTISLQLRLDPPGRIVIERLDMRIGSGHVLVTEQTYAVGRYLTNGLVHWVHAHMHIFKSSPAGAALEFTNADTLNSRDSEFQGTGSELTTEDRNIVINSNAGLLVKPLGIAIASLCGSFGLIELASGPRSLVDMRRVIIKHPEQVCRFISTGQIV